MKKSELKQFTSALALSAMLIAQTTPVFAATVVAQGALSANQGLLDSTSTGIVHVSVTKTKLVQITDLHDMTLAAWKEADGDVQMVSDACVYSSTPGGGYSITVSGNSAAGSEYSIADSNNNKIPYAVQWNAAGANSLSNTGTGLSHGVAANMSHAATDSADCSGHDTARLIVNIAHGALTAVPDGAYSGTLTLLVAPV